MNLIAYKKNAFYVNYEILCTLKLLNRIHKVRYKRDESSGFGFVLSIFNEGAQFILVRLWNPAWIRSWNQPVLSNKG